MVFSYTPKSDTFFFVDHKLALISVVNGLNSEDLLKTKVFIMNYQLIFLKNLNNYIKNNNACIYLYFCYRLISD